MHTKAIKSGTVTHDQDSVSLTFFKTDVISMRRRRILRF